MADKKLTLQQQADEVLRRAEEKGVNTNFFFVTTFKRYQVQMRIMAELEKQINELGGVVQKEYVKGRTNIYTNPAITEYNKTATAANGTVSTLINIVRAFEGEGESQASKLQKLMAMTDD